MIIDTVNSNGITLINDSSEIVITTAEHGLSNYELAISAGLIPSTATEQDWLDTLTAYGVAKTVGKPHTSTIAEWLISITAYGEARRAVEDLGGLATPLEIARVASLGAWLDSLTAYGVAKYDNGYEGTLPEWLNSLNVYSYGIEQGVIAPGTTLPQFLESLHSKVLSVERTTGTGLPGATDTYTMTFQGVGYGSLPTYSYTFTVTNGADINDTIASLLHTWSSSKINTELSLKANVASPTFTGIPAAPTAAADTNSTQVATTAYVLGQASSTAPTMDGTATVGTSKKYARADHIHASDTSRVTRVTTTVDNTLVRFNGTAGAIQTSSIVVDDSNNITVPGTLTFVPTASATPAVNGQLTFEATSNTSVKVKLKGSDGVVRSATLTLAP